MREKYPSIHITAASNISLNLPDGIYTTEALLRMDNYCMEYIGVYREGLIGPVKK